MPGPPPKPKGQRQRRNTTSTAASFEASAAQRIELPEGRDWHPLTLAWWNTIWDSPMVAEWVDADVPALVLLADLVNRYWTEGDAKLAAEIRMQQREFGLSPLSRRTLQWEIKRAKSEAPVAPPPARTPTQRRSSLDILQGGRKAG